MKRRALLALSGAALSSLAGCSDAIPFGSDGAADATTVEQPGCSSYKVDQIVKPSEETLGVNYEVSGELSGDTDSWEETISLQNTGRSPVVLTGDGVLFETARKYTFSEFTLIPSAEVTFITFGDPSASTATSCPKYDYVRRIDLEEPLLQDQTARVAFLELDGGHLFDTEIELPSS
ncbi:hypothetical protein ACFPYI_21540 [Halomarina salina]|uniref:Lipoprotein n=1 Tax=Halomarina salina TaxID=1872699 RepID=A0ABD5RTK3_9EURY|nr:hypothetical protein [Halomarina salina]